MKKLFTESRYKKYNKRRSEKSLKKNLEFKDYQRKKNKAEQGVDEENRKKNAAFKTQYPDYKFIFPPSSLSLIKNPDLVIDFIDEIKNCYDRDQKVFVRMENVEEIEYDAIVLMLSILIRFKSKGIKFNGNYPVNKKADRILRESGFIKNLFRSFPDSDRYQILEDRTNSIHTHAWKNVDSDLSADLIERASETVWGAKKRCQGVQRALIELMQNTNNHAVVDAEGEKHWWLSVNHVKEENKVTFSFVDYGVGVFESLGKKPKGNKFYGAITKMISAFNLTGNPHLLELILRGDLHKTVTGKHYRGKGLPGINDALRRGSFSNLFIISNNVFADVSNNDFRQLKTNFSGTFVYWELIPENLNYDAAA